MQNKQAEIVYNIVRNIPKGYVLTYKAVAQLAEVSNPRQVGHILHLNPFEGEVPCHRVVSSSGKVAKTFAFGGGKAQQKLLEKEGILFIKDKVNLNIYLWNPFSRKNS